MLRLAIYDFEIVYKPGKDNIMADMLSRLPSECEVNTNPEDEYLDVLIASISSESETDKVNKLENQDFARLQDQDEDLMWIKNIVSTNHEIKQKEFATEYDDRRVL